MNSSVKSLLKKAFDHFQTAEHLYHTTLPVAKEPKLLLAIVKSISNSLEYFIQFILEQEKMPSPEGLLQKINTLRPVTDKHHLSNQDIVFMLRIQEILHLQKQSPVEFKRGDKRIICSEDYDLEILSPKEIENFLQHLKKILQQAKNP